MRFLLLLVIVCLYMVMPSEGCAGKSTSKSESHASSGSYSGNNGDPNLFNRGSFDQGQGGQGQGGQFHGVSVGTSCDSNGNCKKYEQKW